MPRKGKRSRSDGVPATAAQCTIASEEIAAFRSDAMVQMWREGLLCDAEVHVDGRVFPAHRIVLAACSTFMRSAFTVGLSETTTASVVLEEVAPAVFEAVLEFVYAGTCTFDESLSLEVLQAASRLGVRSLEIQVETQIAKRVDPATCLEVWKAGDVLSMPEVVKAAQECAQEGFLEVAAQDAWLAMPASWLECLLNSGKLAVDKEEQVFEAVTRWHAAQRPPPSLEALDRLLALVRWPLMEQGFVAERVNTSPLVTSHPGGALAVATAFQAALYGACPTPRLGKGRRVFRFESAFDTNGVLYDIGTCGGTTAYRNPHEAGQVVASASSFEPGYGKPQAFVEHAVDDPYQYNQTRSIAQSWMAVDLGERRSLVLDHYCLRSDGNEKYKPRTWELQGSNDGQSWQTLRRHEEDDSLSDESMSTAAWPVDAGGQSFRCFRVLQTGANSFEGDEDDHGTVDDAEDENLHHLMLTGIELYGRAHFLE